MAIALLLMLLVGFQPAQEDTSSKPPKRGDIVVARGCIKGAILESMDLSRPGGVDRFTELITYRMTGDKKTLEAIRKEHDGHSDAITGELRTDLPTSTESRGKTFGKTRITVGAGPVRAPLDERTQPMPVLKVTSFEHTGESCR